MYDTKQREREIHLFKVRYIDINARIEFITAHPEIDPVQTESGEKVTREKYLADAQQEKDTVAAFLNDLGVDAATL